MKRIQQNFMTSSINVADESRMNIKCWYTLFSSVFIWRKKKNCIFYNSQNFSSLQISIQSLDLDLFIKKMQDIDNLYCVEITEKELNNEDIKKMVDLLSIRGFGRLVEQKKDSEYKPISLPPILNLQSEINRLTTKNSTDLTIGEHVLRNLHEIQIILSKKVDYRFIDLLIVFFDSLVDIVSKITITDNNLMLVHDRQLCTFFCKLQTKKIILFQFSNISADVMEFIEQLQTSHLHIIILVYPDHETSHMKKINDYLKSSSISYEWNFQIFDSKNYNEAEVLIEKHSLENTEIKPVYTGKNIKFFEDNIYLTEEDLQRPGLSRREVFAHQALNTNDFGRLTIMSDGKVYANPYFPALGTIEDDIRELVYKEMTEGRSWLRIRDMKPCCDCIYQWLCPSPSNYELAIGRPNLCHVKP